jgi:hypothetical protein
VGGGETGDMRVQCGRAGMRPWLGGEIRGLEMLRPRAPSVCFVCAKRKEEKRDPSLHHTERT